MSFKILDAGLLSTIQDLGRVGHQSSGISPAGALDYKSAILANQLVGNEPNTALLEMNLKGITFESFVDTTIATAGAPMKVLINQVERPVGRSLSISKGDVIEIGFTNVGMRTYLAVPGGFKVDEILGSAATHLRSKIGGFKGRALEGGDRLDFKGNFSSSFPYMVREFQEAVDSRIRIFPAANYEEFTPEAQKTLVDSAYVIGKNNDRMGMRLEGQGLTTISGDHDILSEPTQIGNVQVPKNGQPIILLSDRQTTGGYTRIASVAKVDLPKLVQMRPGDEVRFEMIDLSEASVLYKKEMLRILNREYLQADRQHEFFRRRKAERIEGLLVENN